MVVNSTLTQTITNTSLSLPDSRTSDIFNRMDLGLSFCVKHVLEKKKISRKEIWIEYDIN